MRHLRSFSATWAHYRAEPRAISKKRQRSDAVYFPFPSAIFSGMDVEALSNLPAVLQRCRRVDCELLSSWG